MSENTLVRFAPSPTGRLHVGNARVAVLNWFFSKQRNGQFLLRMDDTDLDRSTKEFEDGIIEDLSWLGFKWDMFDRQSERNDRYDLAIEKLKADGRLYACYETPEELELKRKIRLGQGRPPVYDREGMSLSDEQKQAYEAEGRKPHWRFLLLDEVVAWEDMARGAVHFEPGHLSDPVLIRNDGRPLYTLSSVVDDGELKVTHVIRGEDHVSNTAVQVQLFKALGFDVPEFAHLPLLVGADGKGLSKRLGSLGLRDLREDGIEPLAILAYLTKLGSPLMAEGTESEADLSEGFDIGAYGRASPRFDPVELWAVNSRILHHLSYEDAKSRLDGIGLVDADEAFWNCVGGNIEKMSECHYWWSVIHGDAEGLIEDDDADFVKEAADLLPEGEWGADIYKSWIDAVKDKTGRKGKNLFMPLRKALTGRTNGPELRDILPLMGYERAVTRMKG